MKVDRVIVLLCTVNLVETLGYALVLPLIPFIAQRSGVDGIDIGVVFASYSVCQLITAPLFGSLSDRWGIKPLLLLSQCGTSLGFLVLARSHTFTLLVLSRMIDGLSAGNVSLLYAVILDRYEQAHRIRYFGLLTTCTGVGILIGPLLGSRLGAHNLAVPAYVAMALSLVTLVLTVSFFSESTPTGERWRMGSTLGALRDGLVRKRLQVVLVNNVIFNAFLLALPLFLQRRFAYTQREVGVVITLLIALAAFFQLAILQKLLARYTETRLAVAGLVLYGFGFVLLLFAPTILIMMAAGACVMWALVVLNPVLTALLARQFPAHHEGRLMGINQSVVSLGQIAGPLLGYAAISALGSAGLGLLCLVLTAMGLVSMGHVVADDKS